MAEVPEPPQPLAADTAEAESQPKEGGDDAAQAKSAPGHRDAIAKPGERRDAIAAPGPKAQASKRQPAKDALLGF